MVFSRNKWLKRCIGDYVKYSELKGGLRYNNDINKRFTMNKRLFSSNNDYYSILGGSKNDTAKELKKKYRKKALESHPDTGNGDGEMFKQVNEAWEVLKDEEQRKLYDQLGHSRYKGYKETGSTGNQSSGNPFSGGGMDINDIFSNLFGGGGQRRNRKPNRSPQSGEDLPLRVELSFTEAIKGTKRSFAYNRLDKCVDCKGSGIKSNEKPDEKTCSDCGGHGVTQQMVGNMMFTQSTCNTCHGIGSIVKNGCKKCGSSGQIRKKKEIKDFSFPPGVDTGSVFVKPNSGNFGAFGGNYGDLVIKLVVQRDLTGNFIREGLDLVTKLEVNLVKTLIGGSCEIKGPLGDLIEVVVKPGTLHGQILRLQSKGVKYGSQKGNMFLKVNIKPIKNLTKKQIELLEEFDKEENLKLNTNINNKNNTEL